MDFRRIADLHHLPVAPDGHKHYRDGWVNVECPFCSGNPGYHLGYCVAGDFFRCWRCGRKKTLEALMGVLRISLPEARRLFRQNKGRPQSASARIKPKIRRTSKLKMPLGTAPLTQVHRSYLQGRGYDPDRLARTWGLLGTGPVGPYKFRIIAPIIHEGEMVSYQGRDITGRSPLRYKACAQSDEVRDHKHCLYGADDVPGEAVVVVEGIADAWRLGAGAVATFGITYTRQQVLLLRQYSTRLILFDTADSQAVAQAHKLAAELSAFRGTTAVIELPEFKDPGEMPQEEADQLMNELIGLRE